MREAPRSQRVRLWVWLYVQLFGPSEDTDNDDGTEESRDETKSTETAPPGDESE